MRWALLSIFTALSICTLGFSVDYTVPGDYLTMQEALDALLSYPDEANSITLQLAEHYEADITVPPEIRFLKIKGLEALPENPRIIADASRRVFICNDNAPDENDSLVFQHIAICGQSSETNYGGLSADDSDIIFRDVHFLDNIRDNNHGGALLIVDSNVAFYDCLFQNNEVGSVDPEEYWNGGAIYCTNSSHTFSSLEMYDCFFESNQALHQSSEGVETCGGAICAVGDRTDLTLQNCQFHYNVAPVGGGLYASAHVNVDGCTFYRNTVTTNYT